MLRDANTTSIAERVRRPPLGGDSALRRQRWRRTNDFFLERRPIIMSELELELPGALALLLYFVRGRPRLTSGLGDVRGGCAADVATTTRILALPFRGHTTNECGFPQSIQGLFHVRIFWLTDDFADGLWTTVPLSGGLVGL
jgi:hypothetical protein